MNKKTAIRINNFIMKAVDRRSRHIVFYADKVYGDYAEQPPLHDLPDGCYIWRESDRDGKHWYLKDLTPVLLEDVPKPLLLWIIVLT